jgi:acetyl esterase/lipase
VQALIKPLARIILKPPPPTEDAGSPRINPHKAALEICHVEESIVAETRTYTSSNKTAEKQSTTHKLYYFAGGGFRGVPAKEHWVLCAELCLELSQYEINIVSYPLAPNNPAPTTMPHLQRLYHTLAEQSKRGGWRITLMGDSSGANLALLLGIYSTFEFLNDNDAEVCPLENIMVMSPPTDLRNQNPGFNVIDHGDSILSRNVIEEVANRWKGKWQLSDPKISPLLADLSGFRLAKMKVDGVVGKTNVLAPAAILFRKRLSEFGFAGDWLEWEKQMHCFPLLFSHHVSEGVAGKN